MGFTRPKREDDDDDDEDFHHPRRQRPPANTPLILSAIEQVERRLSELSRRVTQQRESLEQLNSSMRAEHRVLMDSVGHLLLVRAIKASGECPASIPVTPPSLHSRHLDPDVILSIDEACYDTEIERRLSNASVSSSSRMSPINHVGTKLKSRFLPSRASQDGDGGQSETSISSTGPCVNKDDHGGDVQGEDLPVRCGVASSFSMGIRDLPASSQAEATMTAFSVLQCKRSSQTLPAGSPVTPAASTPLAEDSGSKRTSTVQRLAKAFGKSGTFSGSPSNSPMHKGSFTSHLNQFTQHDHQLLSANNSSQLLSSSLPANLPLTDSVLHTDGDATPSTDDSSRPRKAGFQFGIRRQNRAKLQRQGTEPTSKGNSGSNHDLHGSGGSGGGSSAATTTAASIATTASPATQASSSQQATPSGHHHPAASAFSAALPLYSTAKMTGRWLFGVKQKRNANLKEKAVATNNDSLQQPEGEGGEGRRHSYSAGAHNTLTMEGKGATRTQRHSDLPCLASRSNSSDSVQTTLGATSSLKGNSGTIFEAKVSDRKATEKKTSGSGDKKATEKTNSFKRTGQTSDSDKKLSDKSTSDNKANEKTIGSNKANEKAVLGLQCSLDRTDMSNRASSARARYAANSTGSFNETRAKYGDAAAAAEVQSRSSIHSFSTFMDKKASASSSVGTIESQDNTTGASHVRAKIRSFQEIVEKTSTTSAANLNINPVEQNLKRTRTFNDTWWQQRSSSQRSRDGP